MNHKLFLGDCLDIFTRIQSASIDMILVDTPFAMTAQGWDTLIPFPAMWAQVERVLKPNAAAVFFGSQPFTSMLIASNYKQFRHEWIWEKNKPTGHLNSGRSPMKAHENILVFSDGLPTYNPQMTHGHVLKSAYRKPQDADVYNKAGENYYASTSRFPRSVIRFDTVPHKERVHPNQKPVALLSYLIRTYSNEGDTVLDFTMGSGSTGVACALEGRNFIGIELTEKYYNIAHNRIENACGKFEMTEAERKTGQMALLGATL